MSLKWRGQNKKYVNKCGNDMGKGEVKLNILTTKTLVSIFFSSLGIIFQMIISKSKKNISEDK